MCLETERVNASGLSKPLGPQLHSSYCAAQDLFSLPSAMASNCLSAPKSTSGSHQGAPFLGKPPNFAPCLLPLRMSLMTAHFIAPYIKILLVILILTLTWLPPGLEPLGMLSSLLPWPLHMAKGT